MAAQYKDYYQILGLKRTASAKEIKDSYRKLAREFHPDLHSGTSKKEAEEKFKEINEAYEVLGDINKRKKYDTLGTDWQHGQDWQPRSSSASDTQFYTWGNKTADGFSGSGFSDFFEALFGNGFNFGQDHPGFNEKHRSTAMERGRDLESELELSLEEAYHGGQKTLLLDQRGTKLTVKIPPGVRAGGKIRLKGQGMEALPKGKRGDLLLNISLKPHAIFTLNGDDLEVKTVITPPQAVGGDKITVPTLDGDVSLSLPPMTHNGQKFRLRGKGWPKKGGARGNQYVQVVIDIPSQMTPEETELYQKISQLKKQK